MDNQQALVKELSKEAITKEDLVQSLAEIIREIRDGNPRYKNFINSVKELENLDKITESTRDVNVLFANYKQIQKASIELRKILESIFHNDAYDAIEYSFYYNGKRYHTDTINAKWLTVSGSTGELKLRLNHATEDLKTAVYEKIEQSYNEAFNQHYAKMLKGFAAMYNGTIGRGGAINYGHLAEAFEEHMEQHHTQAMRAMDQLAASQENLSVVQKYIVSFVDEEKGTVGWHEAPKETWAHVIHSLGIQRGTVAGDVGKSQVKQSKTGSPRIRLARLNTLIDGIQVYSDIFNEHKTPVEVAEKLATYISEPVRKVSETIIDGVIDQDIQSALKELNASIDKNPISISL